MVQFIQSVLARPLLPVGLRDTDSKVFMHRPAWVALALLIAASLPGTAGELTRSVLVDAYVQVSVFVAATLLILYGSERLFGYNIGRALRSSRYFQVPLASILGAMPGCGGAIVVVTAYTTGNVRFGAVVATLVATMGDAAFLLIAARPDAAIIALPLALIAGTLTGLAVDRWVAAPRRPHKRAPIEIAPRIGALRWRDVVFCLLAALTLPGGLILLTGYAIRPPFETILSLLAILGVASCAAIWACSPVRNITHPDDEPMSRCTEETSFISIWVFGAFLAYEYAVEFSGLNLETLFATVAPLLPLIAIIIGLIPGCGPQVLVTTLYINGLVPFSALLGNMISNDGDALFPAIALDARAAVLATVYSTVPALILAYSFFWLAPGFLN